MDRHLVIFLKDGQVDTVAADFQADIDCVVVSPGPIPVVEGEPWIRPIESPVTGKDEDIVITPVRVEFLPEVVEAVVSAEDISKSELLALLKPASGQ